MKPLFIISINEAEEVGLYWPGLILLVLAILVCFLFIFNLRKKQNKNIAHYKKTHPYLISLGFMHAHKYFKVIEIEKHKMHIVQVKKITREMGNHFFVTPSNEEFVSANYPEEVHEEANEPSVHNWAEVGESFDAAHFVSTKVQLKVGDVFFIGLEKAQLVVKVQHEVVENMDFLEEN